MSLADGSPHPFQVTMRRFGRKLDVARVREELPLSLFFFDCLHLDGEDTLRALRSERPELPVILTSGYDEERTAERNGSGAVVGFLRKPYEPEALIERVTLAVEDHRQA